MDCAGGRFRLALPFGSVKGLPRSSQPKPVAMLTTEARTREFPSLKGMTYLNTAAEGIPPRCVGEALREYSQHKLKGMRGRDDHFARLEQCREIAAKKIHLKPSEVSFCSCSSEACNQ